MSSEHKPDKSEKNTQRHNFQFPPCKEVIRAPPP